MRLRRLTLTIRSVFLTIRNHSYVFCFYIFFLLYTYSFPLWVISELCKSNGRFKILRLNAAATYKYGKYSHALRCIVFLFRRMYTLSSQEPSWPISILPIVTLQGEQNTVLLLKNIKSYFLVSLWIIINNSKMCTSTFWKVILWKRIFLLKMHENVLNIAIIMIYYL